MRRYKHSVIDVAFDAMTIFERLNAGATPLRKKHNEKFIKSIITQWSNNCADGDMEKFQRRLAWDQLDINSISSVLSSSPSHTLRIPDWSVTLEQILNFLSSNDNNNILVPNPIVQQKMLPFEEVFQPLIVYARKSLLVRFGVTSFDDLLLSYPFEISAYLDFEHELLTQLSWLCGEVLYEKFSLFRPISWSIEGLTGPISAKGSGFYRKFVTDFDLTEMIEEYPVLGRFIATSIRNWINRTYQLWERITSDMEKIKELLSLPQYEDAKIQKVYLSLSDLHHHGQSVSIFKFNNGKKIVYKPRNLQMDIAFEKLINWCNENMDGGLYLQVPKVINKNDYGWVEFINYKECDTLQEVSKYYERAGQLLSLVYILGGNDFHHENIISSGEHPVLLDFESLLHHRSNLFDKSLEKTMADTKMESLFWDSVLRTGLLPQWIYDKDDARQVIYDVSGLGGVEAQPLLEKQTHWEAINTDAIRIAYQESETDIRENRVLCKGELQFPSNYVNEIVKGFSALYGLFVLHKKWLIESKESPLVLFQEAFSRFIFRQTQVYSYVRSRCLLPEVLKSGINFGIELELLARPYLYSKNKNFAWELFHYEVAELSNLDIPHLSAKVNTDTLLLGNGVAISNLFQGPSYFHMLERINDLNENGLLRQIHHIKSSLYARKIVIPSEPSSLDFDKHGHQHAPSNETFLIEANKISNILLDSIIRGDDGTITWIGLTPLIGFNRFQYQPVGWDVYSGMMGMAIFLSALSKENGETIVKKIVLDSLVPLQESIRNEKTLIRKSFLREVDYGGVSGIASVVYGLIKISQFLDAPELLEDALLLSDSITFDEISSASQLDYVNGTAGVLSVLVLLYLTTRSHRVLEKARHCGRVLLAKRFAIGANEQYLTWISPGESKPLGGISHGSAGIALSLIRLYEITNEEKFLKAAMSGVFYENSLFVPEKFNWLDLRNSSTSVESPIFASTWCNGAPGIGLARLECYKINGDRQLLFDAQQSLEFIYREPLSTIDHLCCGNFGRLETLRIASNVLGDRIYLQEARRISGVIIEKAKRLDGYQTLEGFPPNVFSPGFFQGLAGIGYELLCLANPQLPSVLLFG